MSHTQTVPKKKKKKKKQTNKQRKIVGGIELYGHTYVLIVEYIYLDFKA